ncbi:MAG: hypothetical protein KIT76_09115 [Pseudolabrys sp.]|nr:hypothetical protein [Pseudolabrys sp.]
MKTYTKVKFKKSDLGRVHPAHLSYIIAAAHAVNELNSIRIYQIFEQTNLDEKPAEYAFVMIRQQVLLRHATAKIYEFNLMTSRYFGSIKKTFPSFAEKWRKEYLPIAKDIRSSVWLPILRNKMAFHFSADDYIAGFSRIKESQDLSFIFGDNAGETAFTFAEQIIAAPLLDSIGMGDIRQGLKRVSAFSNKLSSKIISFVIAHQREVFSNYGILRNIEKVKAHPESFGIYDHQFIPVFVADRDHT